MYNMFLWLACLQWFAILKILIWMEFRWEIKQIVDDTVWMLALFFFMFNLILSFSIFCYF